MKRSTSLSCRLLAASGLVVLGLAAAACTPTTPQFSVKQPVLKASLGNGIRLVVVPDKSTPLVEVDVRYEVGANEDPKNKAGLAHLVEHMMFQQRFGPKSVPIAKRLPTFQVLPQLATFFNAYTIWDKTHYFLQAPKEELPKLLQLEAARMATGCKTIPEEQFEREREVVRAEIRGNLGKPEGLMLYDALRLAYPEGHPYHEMVGGNDEQLSNITLDDVCTFMSNYYVPSRAIIVVTGNADVEQTGKMVSKYFGGIPAGHPAPRLKVEPIVLKKQFVTKEYDLERTVVNVLWALPAHYTSENDNVGFLQYVFASVASGMADEYDVCDAVGATELGGVLAPIMWAGFEVHKGKTAQQCLDFIWKAAKQTHRFFQTGGYKEELMKRAHAKQQFVESMESISARAGFIADSVQFDHRVKFTGEDNYFYKHLDGIDKLDVGKFQSFVDKTLDKNKAIVFIAKASDKGAKRDKRSKLKFTVKSHDQKPEPVIDPATANTPLPAPKNDSILAGAVHYTLGNGMKIVLLPYEGMPIVQANLLFRSAGGVQEPESKAGLASIAASIGLPMDSEAMQAAGINVQGSSALDYTLFRSGGINIYLAEIINGLERTIKAGRVNQKGIERYRSKFKDRFDRPSYQRDHAYNMELEAAIYGPKHPYVTKGDPTPKTLSNFGRDDALGFGHEHYSAKNATLIVAGNFDLDRARSIIGDSFGGWSPGREDKPVAADARASSGPKHIGVVGKEGMSQMRIAIAFPAPAGMDEHTAARQVLASMMTLQMSKVRTELGSTYGVYARLNRKVGPGYYVVGGQVDATRAGESLKFMREKLQELRDGVDFNKYFVVARQMVLKKLLAESTESYSLAGRLTQIALYALSPDAIDKRAREVAALMPRQVKALMAVELDLSREVIVNMADRKTLESSFAEAGLDNVRIVDPMAHK